MPRFQYLTDKQLSVQSIWAWAKRLVQDLNGLDARTAAALPAGMLMPGPMSIEPNGWLLCDGRTVAISEYPDLFLAISYTYGGSGGLFALPDYRNRILMGAGSTVALGAQAGAASATIGVTNLPSHNHGVNDPGHSHGFAGAAHNHGVNDPGHTHPVTDPGHVHPNGSSAGAAGSAGTDIGGNTGSATTGITIGSATTGITTQNATAGGTVGNALTGITTTNTGGNTPLSVLNPVAGVNVFIKT